MPERSAAPRILLADDDADTRELYGFVLRSYGFDVIEVADGAAALDSLAAHPPDLAIVDLRMPRVDGFEVCRACKSAQPQPVPTIVVTALATRAVAARARMAGADVVLIKPLSPDQVLAEVVRVLNSRGFSV